MEMANRLKLNQISTSLPATVSGSGVCDFPVGSVKSRAAVRGLLDSRAAEVRQAEAAELGTLTAYEEAMAQGVDPESVLWTVRLARIAEERARIYGTKLLTPEEIRHAKKIAKIADEITGGRFNEICNSDAQEEKRIRALAEEKLKGRG
jgi:hypothetical protein